MRFKLLILLICCVINLQAQVFEETDKLDRISLEVDENTAEINTEQLENLNQFTSGALYVFYKGNDFTGQPIGYKYKDNSVIYKANEPAVVDSILKEINSEGKRVYIRYVGEQHVKEDCNNYIPSAKEWLDMIASGELKEWAIKTLKIED